MGQPAFPQSRSDLCQRYKVLDYQGFYALREPGVSEFVSKWAIAFTTRQNLTELHDRSLTTR